MSAEALDAGYWRAYRTFYHWGAILRGAWTKEPMVGKLRHLAYAGGWGKLEPFWDLVIRLRRVASFLPLLESVLASRGRLAARGRRLEANDAVPGSVCRRAGPIEGEGR